MDHELNPDLLLGQNVSKWRLGKVLDKGKSGCVYSVEADLDVAIKVYFPRLFAGPTAEAETARIDLQRQLGRHGIANLIPILDGGRCEASRLHFVAMPRINARNLDQQLGEIPFEVIPVLMKQVASAACALHNRGMVHRDIKPSNIVWDQQSLTATLLDLGVLRRIGSSVGTQAGGFLGTWRYSPPEFADSRVEDVAGDPWPWIAVTFYQLGGVLHDLLMRKRLFEDCLNDHLLHRAIDNTRPPLNGNSGLTHFEALARRCLEKNPTKRLTTVCWGDFGVQTAPSVHLDASANATDGVRSVTALARHVASNLRAAVSGEALPPLHISATESGLHVRFGSASRLGHLLETFIEVQIQAKATPPRLVARWGRPTNAGAVPGSLPNELPSLAFPLSPESLRNWLHPLFPLLNNKNV